MLPHRPTPKSQRHVYLGPKIKASRTMPVYAGADCASSNHVIKGPAIIEEETMTLLFLPGMTAQTGCRRKLLGPF